MARKRRKAKRKSPQKYKRAFNIKTAAFSYLTLNATTQTLFNTNPQEFFLGGLFGSDYFGSAGAGSTPRITLKEILAGFTLSGNSVTGFKEHGAIMPQVQANLRANLGSGVMMLGGLALGKVAVQKLGVSRAFNKTVRSLGAGNLVKM